MKTEINTPKSINHIGGRSNNEDSIYPLLGHADKNDKLFMVCDGVGGNEKGEVASRLACDKFEEYFRENTIETSDDGSIAGALKYTEAAFDKYITKNPESKGMGTTLTLLHLHSGGATVAHIGDSRVYQFRNGEIMFQTSDHSLVNDLLKAGVLNEEQAKDHPQKNVISRAIQGASVKPTKADVELITDIKPGDYFFLCTDGILENITDFEIGQILAQDLSNAEKLEQISKRCEEAPNDNFSTYLVQIEKVEGLVVSNSERTVFHADVDESAEETIVEAEVEVEVEVEERLHVKQSLLSRLKKLLPVFMILAGFSIVLFWFVKPDKEEYKKKKETVIEQMIQTTDSNKDKPKANIQKETENLKSNANESVESSDQKVNTKPEKDTLIKEKDTIIENSVVNDELKSNN